MLLNCGVGEDSWESLDCKEIKPVHPKGNQSWIFTGWTEAKVETPIFWPPNAKKWLIGKNPDVGKDWRQEKGITEDEKFGSHLWLDRHEFEQAPGVADGQWGLACCGPWGRKESDTTERLNWTELNWDVHWQMWNIYRVEYYSAIKRNAFESTLMKWMNLSLLYKVK